MSILIFTVASFVPLFIINVIPYKQNLHIVLLLIKTYY